MPKFPLSTQEISLFPVFLHANIEFTSQSVAMIDDFFNSAIPALVETNNLDTNNSEMIKEAWQAYCEMETFSTDIKDTAKQLTPIVEQIINQGFEINRV